MEIVVNTVLEKEQVDPFRFVAVKKLFSVTVGDFDDINGIIILIMILITLNPVKNAISLKMIVAGQLIFLVFCAWNLVFGNAWSILL